MSLPVTSVRVPSQATDVLDHGAPAPGAAPAPLDAARAPRAPRPTRPVIIASIMRPTGETGVGAHQSAQK